MIFKILATGKSSSITSTPNIGYLIEDQWDDWFQHSTMYDLYVVDSSSQKQYMGKVKIGQKGMDKGQRRPALSESFSHLSEDFFSLGQDSYYYENIKNLGDVKRKEILASLNDIAYNTKLIRAAQKEPVTKTSLLRSVPLTTVKGQFNRIALGGARLTPYNFEYRSVPIREGIEPITIEFNVDPDSYPPSNIHVIIGRNGVGKTYLISNMIRSIIQSRNDIRENVGETRFFHDRQIAVDHFSRIIFVSFSAFDELNFKTRSEKFVRIGLPARSGENSTYARLSETFAASFTACLHGPQRSLLIKVLHMLKSDPMFSESGIVDYCEEDTQYNNDTLISVFSRLSSGHKIILLSITQLVEKVMEKTLVFLDEPEGHLHPPLLSAFIRALSELLLDKNGVAIIATHSPVILQEVSQNCIWKLRRTGAHCKAERLNIESFGSDITTLKTEVFGLEVINSGFHSLLQELVNRYGDYNIVLRKLNGQLGAEGRALVKTMVKPSFVLCFDYRTCKGGFGRMSGDILRAATAGCLLLWTSCSIIIVR